MYSVTETEDYRLLFRLPNCRKKFVVNGKLVKFDKDGIAKISKDDVISVRKINHFLFHKIRMAKSRQMLYHNSTIEQHDLGEKIKLNEEEILMASLEVDKNI